MAEKKQQRIERSGPMAGSVRQGRRLLSPIAATGVLMTGDWVRDDLPDLIWPVLVLADLGPSAARQFIRWQGSVEKDLHGDVSPQRIAEGIDGRLTGLDRLIEQVPEAADIVADRAAEYGLITPNVVGVLSSYPERPAQWFAPGPAQAMDQSQMNSLAEAILSVLRDGHRESLIKCLRFWGAVQTGTFSSDNQTIELLKPYPDDAATRPRADSAIRAMWGAIRTVELQSEPTRLDDAIKWAKIFWGVNSMTSKCIRPSDGHVDGVAANELTSDSGEGLDAAVSEDPYQAVAVPSEAAHLRQRAMDLLSSYFEALETSPTRLYDVERHEVNTGLVTRAGREVIAALGAPDLWNMENGSHVVRILVETRIYVEWMAKQDPKIYEQFKSYGQGKAKLYARISQELAGEGDFPGVAEAVAEFRKLSHDDDVLEHQIVDTSDSFSGKSIRAMAEECGLIDLYRRAYYIASGVSHSEWWSIETHCMVRCQNILHRGHLIPSLDLSGTSNVAVAESWIETLYALIWRSLEIQGADKEAVDQAFSWLKGDAVENGAVDSLPEG